MIHTIHWDIVNKNDHFLLLIWPAPMDHDMCFKNGGFNDFADSNDEWDSDFEKLIIRLIEKLLEFGEVYVENEIIHAETLLQKLFKKKNKPLSLVEQITISTQYGYPSFKIHFGNISLKTGLEHPLFIVDLPNMEKANDIINHVSQGRDLNQTQLDWSKIENL